MFLSYKLRSIWGFINFTAEYFYVFLYFIVLVLNLFWWFNGSLILQFSTFILLNYRIGGKVFSQQKKNKSKASEQRERSDTLSTWQLSDRLVLEMKEGFDEEISTKIKDMRKLAWNFHFLVLTLTLIIIYPSQYLLTFQHEAA